MWARRTATRGPLGHGPGLYRGSGIVAADHPCWNNARRLGGRQPGVGTQHPHLHQPGGPGDGAEPTTSCGPDVRRIGHRDGNPGRRHWTVREGPAGRASAGREHRRQDLQPGAPAGTYIVAWRVTSRRQPPGLRHLLLHRQTRRHTTAHQPANLPADHSNQTQPTRMPGWLKLVVDVVAIIFGITVARRASRCGNASRP